MNYDWPTRWKRNDKRRPKSSGGKEFFRVTLADVEAFAKGRSIKMELTMLAEAREYRETLAALLPKVSGSGQTNEFPDSVLPAAAAAGV